MSSTTARAPPSDSASRTTPAPLIMARWSMSRSLVTSTAPKGSPPGGRTGRASSTVHPMPSIGSAPSTARSAPLGSGAPTPAEIRSARRAPKTMPSRSELEASRLAPCTPVQATSPTAHRPGQGRGSPQVGDHPAREVVGRRRDRQPVVLGVEPDGGQRGGDGREALGEALEAGRVEPEVVDALLGHAGRHGPADDVAGRQLVDEALAVPVAQQGAVAAQRLGEQRPGHGRVVQRGRMELDELDVGRRHPGAQRHGHAVAGGLGRVGGDREELARRRRWPARRGRPAPRPVPTRPPGGSAVTPTQRPPSTSRSRANQPSSTALAER